MKRAIFAAILAVGALHAAPADRALELGRHARADGVPQAAIYDLQQALQSADGQERIAVAIELARCLLGADRGIEAVAVLEGVPASDETTFWLAQAQAQAENFPGALRSYTKVAKGRDGALARDAVYGRAVMLEALGRTDEALAEYARVTGRRENAARLDQAALLMGLHRLDEAGRVLAGVKEPNRRDAESKRYLEGRIALEQDDAAGAERAFAGFDPRNRRLAAGAVIGAADGLLRAGEVNEAEGRLEDFIQRNPRTPELEELFAKLHEVRQNAKDPSNAAFKRWENDGGNVLRSALSTFYLADAAAAVGRDALAVQTYDEFLRMHPGHDLGSEATVQLAMLHLADGNLEGAVRALDGSELAAAGFIDRGRLRFVRAMTHYLAGNYQKAADHFLQAAEYEPRLQTVARTNAALCAMIAGNEPQAAALLEELRKDHPVLAGRLEFERALLAARSGNPDGGEELSWILDRDRDAETQRRARLALSEWKWKGGDVAGAREEFLKISNAEPSAQEASFAVFLADDGGPQSAAAVENAARAFLARHRGTEPEARVRMKWGEVLAREGDYPSARVQFETAAAVAKDPRVARDATFLAARAAARSMIPQQIEEARLLFDEVAKDPGDPLAAQARLEQAQLESALGRPDDAVKLLDRLVADTGDPRLRFRATLKKGETLASTGIPEKVREAVAVFEGVATDADAEPAERNEALSRKAAALESLDEPDAALAAYYAVLNTPRDTQPEYFWYYKAGFDAARLLAEQGRQKEAAAIYEKMGETEGPRSAEAREQVKRLRLENFIWED